MLRYSAPAGIGVAHDLRPLGRAEAGKGEGYSPAIDLA